MSVINELNESEKSRELNELNELKELSELDVLLNHAKTAFSSGDIQKSLELYERALDIDANNVGGWLMKARCLSRLGEWMPAREAFAQTLRLDSNNYSAWLEAGHLCKNMGELTQAAASYQHAINANPNRYEAYLGMARVMALQGQFELTDKAYNEAVLAAEKKSNETVVQVHWLMGQYTLELGHNQEAVRCFSNAIKSLNNAKDEHSINTAAEIQMDWARVLLRLNNRTDAMKLLTIASGATNEATLARLAMLSFRNNFWQEAIEISRRNIELHPQSPWAHWNLAHLLAECWQMEEAEETLKKAESLAPMPGAKALRASVAGRVGDADTALALYIELAKKEGVGSDYASSAAMSSLYSDQLPVKQVAQLHRELFNDWGIHARPQNSFVRKPLDGRRIKMGIVTADFHHQHPVNIFMQPMLRELDKEKFELFVYFVGDSHDEQTALAKSRVEHWIEVAPLNTLQLTKRIDVDDIDVLIDMAGHTGQHRMQTFAQRAAPVQITYLGYPGSTGVPNIDYIFGDDVVTPLGCEELYSEKIKRLPGTVFCYAPEVHYPNPIIDLNNSVHATRPIVFGSFNNVPKLTPHSLKLWAAILEKVPNSRLVLKAPSFIDGGARNAFAKRLEALNVDLTRVEFRGPVGLTDMMAEYADIDIAVDPVPYNGGTTSLQAMWMGVPIITKLGAHYVSRMGASFMSAAGLNEWIAKTDEEYVHIAQTMSNDRAKLFNLKQNLRARLQALPAWDVVQHTRNFEDKIMECILEQQANIVIE